ncbi:MAG: YitT family protein, partial [Clostridia bacterium]|nr:YitT family protein [Clostridia bacterium]
VGSAILFNLDASSGGTDIIAMLLKKYTSLNIGNALLCSDCVIVLAACIAFGMETGLFCITGLVIKSVMIDMVLENIKVHKCFHIITAVPEPITDYITGELRRGATTLEGEGAYTHEGRTVLMTVVSRREAVQLRRKVKELDPRAFLLITNTSEIIGKGFRGSV